MSATRFTHHVTDPMNDAAALCGLNRWGAEEVEVSTQATHVTCPYCRRSLGL